MKKEEYTCNLCKLSVPKEKLRGVIFPGGILEFNLPDRSEHHICDSCSSRIIVLLRQ